MKTIKKVPVELVRVETIPPFSERQNELGKLYYSEEYGGLSHVCLCGCGTDTHIPIKPHWREGWTLTEEDGKVTLTPSLQHRMKCQSHYIITKGIANFV